MDSSTTLQDQRPPQPSTDFSPGYEIDGRFPVVFKIGSGGMGAVYLAEDKRLHRRVAVKVISGDAGETARKRFVREAQLMAGIHAPEIVQVHDFGLDLPSGANYYVMDAHLLSPAEIEAVCRERLRCPPLVFPPFAAPAAQAVAFSLETVLAGDRAVSEETAAALALEILAALRLIHKNEPEIIHRDLKPSNLIFAADGHLMLSDFGIAKAHLSDTESTTTLTMQGAGPGTPLYAAPEQKRGQEVTAATDFYSFGLVMYRMLTGGLPGTASTLLPADVSARVSRKWDTLLSALLQRDPAARLRDHDKVRRQLVSILADSRRRTRLRSLCRFALTRFFPVILVAAGLAAAKFCVPGHPVETRPDRRDEELPIPKYSPRERSAVTESPAPRERSAVTESFDACFRHFVSITNNLVVPPDGEEVVLHSGETLIVPTVTYKGINMPREGVSWYGPRPSKIILDGGCILFSMPVDEVLRILAIATRKRDELLENADHLYSTEEFVALYRGNGFVPDYVGLIDIPVEITANGGTIKADDTSMKTAVVRSRLTSRDGAPVQINFTCGALSVLEVDVNAFGPGVTYGPGRYFKLADYSGNRRKIVKWVE